MLHNDAILATPNEHKDNNNIHGVYNISTMKVIRNSKPEKVSSIHIGT